MSAPARAGWRARLVREVYKATVTVILEKAPEVIFFRGGNPTSDTDGQPVKAHPTAADVVMTSVDAGTTWSVHGVTLTAQDTGNLGRYFRRKTNGGTWADGTPEWLAALADEVAYGRFPVPTLRCAACGWVVEPSPAPDAAHDYIHAAGTHAGHPVRETVRVS